MKKFLCLFGAMTLTLASCSSDDNNDSVNDVSVILPKTIKYTYIDYPSENATYVSTYSGGKVLSINKESERTDYIYEGNLIVKEVNYDTESEKGKDIIIDETVYTYANGKLVGLSFAESFSDNFPNGKYKNRKVFTYNTDGTVKVEKYNTNSVTGVEDKSNYIEILTFENGNLIKSVETNNEFNSVFTAVYEYDSKNNPLKNILGFSVLIDHSEGEGSMSSVNNLVKYTASYSGNSEASVYKRDIIYNESGYPTKITSYKKDGLIVHWTTEYTY